MKCLPRLYPRQHSPNYTNLWEQIRSNTGYIKYHQDLDHSHQTSWLQSFQQDGSHAHPSEPGCAIYTQQVGGAEENMLVNWTEFHRGSVSWKPCLHCVINLGMLVAILKYACSCFTNNLSSLLASANAWLSFILAISTNTPKKKN